jgi:glycolate oxidase FAD binding subunit
VLGPGGTEAALSLLGAPPWEKAEVSVKATCPPADLQGALTDLWKAAARRQLGEFRVAAHAGSGVVRAGFIVPEIGSEEAALLAEYQPGFVAEPGERLARFVADARERLAARQGSLVVVEAPPELKRAVDAWGPPGDAIGLMRRVKRQFDPDRQLSPGRFVGGI